MAYNRKEQGFLKDLQNDEKTCAEKYRQAAQAACDPVLQQLFSEISEAETDHYNTVTQMLDSGKAPATSASQTGRKAGSGGSKSASQLRSQASATEKRQDAYLLADLLATEKYVSAAYNTAVFEFCDEASRKTLSGIQQQEQHHGKQLADYMMANNMYC